MIETITMSLPINELPIDAKPIPQSSGSFLDALSALDLDIKRADQLTTNSALGKTSSPTEMMVALEKVKLEMELVRQVRDKIIGAYQGLLKEQI